MQDFTGPILIFGPAHSGKSRSALKCLIPENPATIVGTANSDDPLMARRIQELRSHWSPHWTGEEATGPIDLEIALQRVPSSAPQVLIDSINLWLANRLVHECERYTLEQLHDRAFHEVDVMIGAIQKIPKTHRLIIVSSELGASLPPSQPLPRILRAAVGIANQKLAEMANTVILQVAGIPQILKKS